MPGQNGITYSRSEVKVKDVTDGASRTLLVAEKYQNPDHYETGFDHFDNQCVYSGHDSDNNGYTGDLTGVPEVETALMPRRDQTGASLAHRFGSAHVEGLHVAYCDGSVHFVEFGVSGRVWYTLGGRDDADQMPEEQD